MNTRMIKLESVAIEAIDMVVVAKYVAWYDKNPGLYTPDCPMTKLVEAAKALQEAVTYRKHECAPVSEVQKDSESISRALKAIEHTRKTGSIGWAVKRVNYPLTAKTGDTITIDYTSGGAAKVVAEVCHSFEYPEGRGLILRLLETYNSFGLGPSGWRYIGFWIPNYPTAAGGFTYRTDPPPPYGM